MIAAARVNADGTFAAQSGFIGPVVHVPGSGVYNLALASSPADTDLLAIEITRIASPGEVASLFVSPGVIGAALFDSTGVLADGSFTITVYDLNP